MDNQKIKDLVEFLETHDSLESINSEILQAETIALNRVAEVEHTAKRLGVSIQSQEAYNVSQIVGDITGIDYLTFQYDREFNARTCRTNSWHSLRYAIGKTIWNYDEYVNCEINLKNDTVKVLNGHFNLIDNDNEWLIKSFANGNNLYSITPELVERIELIRWIESFLCDKMGWVK